MDDHALAVLELPAVRARLAERAATPMGRELAAGLAPAGDAATVAARQAETAEAVRLQVLGPPRLTGAHDVRPAATRAARGGVLEPAALAAVAATVRAALDARRVLEERIADAPLLAAVGSVIEPGMGLLADRIEVAVEPDGSGLRDGATPRLRALRREIAEARRRASERLRSLAASTQLRPHLMEDFVTERGGRPVLAVKASARGAVPGIVHDTSGSGQTLFVEPFAVVELVNRVSEAQAAEREEVERVLAELSHLVSTWAPSLETAVEASGRLDHALSCGELSSSWGGCTVEASDQEVELLGARHPLLDPATAVPIDLPLGDLRTVVFSGPNTGGKTVALKTLGLAALLHQCGLLPPAGRARLPVFDRVLADIGDEQSIERSLSTFSGHVRNLVGILDSATGRSLVLLDEVAAGTDPVEGAALARSLLQRLLERGALTLVTTHYAELKEWASTEPRVANAAVGFDPEALAPTYHVTLGRPGPSHALQIAERLGLDRTVVAAARSSIAPERRATERLLAEAAGAERDAARAREEAERGRDLALAARVEAERQTSELEAALEAVRAGQRAAREEARREAEMALAGARRELEELRGEIRAARREEERRQRTANAPPAAADRAGRERDRRLGAADQRLRAAADAVEAAIDRPLATHGPLGPGDPVLARSLGLRGTIVEIVGDTAELRGVGGARVRVAVDRLEPDPTGQRPTSRPDPPVRVRASTPQDVAHELDVRGRRADEAREAVRAWVDSAHLAGFDEVRVVHGRGTGAVRRAVREELKAHPLVAEQSSESLDGATLVRLDVDRR